MIRRRSDTDARRKPPRLQIARIVLRAVLKPELCVTEQFGHLLRYDGFVHDGKDLDSHVDQAKEILGLGRVGFLAEVHEDCRGCEDGVGDVVEPVTLGVRIPVCCRVGMTRITYHVLKKSLC
jgi:hypothetical protein